MSFFTPTVCGNFPEKRSGHAVVFYNGQMIVFGGYGDWDEEELELQLCKNIWSYNIEASQWTNLITKGICIFKISFQLSLLALLIILQPT